MAAIVPDAGVVAGSTREDLERLVGFRDGWYGCLTGWSDALFELTDAVLCAPGRVDCLPGLSLTAPFRRGWGSVYRALANGRVEAAALAELLVAYRPVHWPLVFAVDVSTWVRAGAATSAGRGMFHHASRHTGGMPVVPGWGYQWIAQLNWARDSWTAPLQARRVDPGAAIGVAAAGQIRDLLDRLGRTEQVPLFVFDAGYDPAALSVDLAEVRAAICVRIRDDRVFYADPAPRPGYRGRPRRHGARFACHDPGTWPTPSAEITTTDERYGRIHVSAFTGLHPKLQRRGRFADTNPPPIVRGTIIRVHVQRLPRRGRPDKALWLWHAGPADSLDLDLIWRAYLHRYDIEHTFRFVKTTLGWNTPALRTPEQADRWTTLTLAAYTQLRLARPIAVDHRLPWQRPQPTGLSPTRVRRAFPHTGIHLHTPASAPKLSRPGPGRPKGARSQPAPRHPIATKG